MQLDVKEVFNVAVSRSNIQLDMSFISLDVNTNWCYQLNREYDWQLARFIVQTYRIILQKRMQSIFYCHHTLDTFNHYRK